MHDRRKKENNTTGKNINVGDIIHIAQILSFFIFLGMIYQNYKITEGQVNIHTQQLNRIEHYLSSKDPQYWTIVNELN